MVFDLKVIKPFSIGLFTVRKGWKNCIICCLCDRIRNYFPFGRNPLSLTKASLSSCPSNDGKKCGFLWFMERFRCLQGWKTGWVDWAHVGTSIKLHQQQHFVTRWEQDYVFSGPPWKWRVLSLEFCVRHKVMHVLIILVALLPLPPGYWVPAMNILLFGEPWKTVGWHHKVEWLRDSFVGNGQNNYPFYFHPIHLLYVNRRSFPLKYLTNDNGWVNEHLEIKIALNFSTYISWFSWKFLLSFC